MKKEKSLAGNSIFYLINNVLNIAFPLVTSIYVAHVLLPDNIGEVAYAQNIAQYFVTFAFLGIPTYGMREVAKVRNNQEKLNKLYSELFTINFISTCVFLAAYLVLVFSVEAYRTNCTVYLIAGGSIALNAMNISFLYEGLEEFKFVSVRNFIFKFVSLALLIALVRSPGDYLNYAAITVIGTAGNYILNMIFAPRFVRLEFKGLNLKQHMRAILMLVVVNFAIEVYSLINTTILGMLSGKANVTFFTYGNKVYSALKVAINSFTMVIVPRITIHYKERNYAEFNRIIKQVLSIIILLSIPLICGIWLVGTDLVLMLFGEAYITSATVLKTLSFSLLISPVGYLLGSRIMLVTGNEKKMILPVAAGAVANVITSFLFIGNLREQGAAIAALISEIVVMLIYVSYGKKYVELSGIIKETIVVIFASIIMTISLILLGLCHIPLLWKLALQVLSAIVVYFGVLVAVKEPITTIYLQKILANMRQ